MVVVVEGSVSTKEEISFWMVAIKSTYGTRTRLRQSRRRPNVHLSSNWFRTVIQGRSNWVEAPLAHLRSAGEVATDPAITLNINERIPSSVIAVLPST